MFQVDDPTAVSSLPTPAAAGTPGYFTDGNPGTGVAATILRADFMNLVMMELTNVVTAAGLTPSKTNNAQVLAAINALIAGQVSGVVGQNRNLAMSVASASAAATLTADEIIVEKALGGLRYCLANFNKTINLATTGAGGMDTGTAPASGYVALYAIYNPTTQVAALLATNATNAVQPNVYGGANPASGYTASALVGVWPTNASSQLVAGYQTDRTFYYGVAAISILSTATQQPSTVPLSAANAIPINARNTFGTAVIASSAAGTNQFTISGSSGSVGQNNIAAGSVFSINGTFQIPIIVAQTVYFTATNSAGSMTLNVIIAGYTI